MIREDVISGSTAPRDIQDLLLRVGGKNPYGEPNFRLCISEGVRKLAGAEYYKWRNGAALRERGGLFVDEDGVTVEVPEEKPISIDVEVRWVKKYPTLRGWILEEWHPAHKFGSRELWESQKVPGHPDVCSLGPYPEEGRYMLALPYGYGQPADGHENDPRFQGRPGLPPAHVLEVAVQYVTRCREFWDNLTPENRLRLWEDGDLHRQALVEKHLRDRDLAKSREVSSILMSGSLESGRVREDWAKSAGYKGHVGN